MARPRRWLAGLAVIAGLCRPASAPVAAAASDAPPFRDLRVESVRLSDVDTEGLQITVRVRATANVTATLRHLDFDRMTIGSLRLTLPPADGPIRLRAGEAVAGLPLLGTRISYRDLESLEPVRQIVTDQRARVRGVLRGRLALSAFQKLSLMSGEAWVIAPLDEEVPVVLPGGTFAQLAGETALAVAEPLWAAGRALQRRLDAAALEQARTALTDSLVALETRYTTVRRDGGIATHRHRSTGFVVGPGALLATAEAVEPWLFDAQLAAAIESRAISVVATSVDIVTQPLGRGASDGPAPTLRGGQLRVTKTLKRSERVISAATRAHVRLRFRGVDENAALLSVAGLDAAVPRSSELAPTAGWQSAVVVTLRRRGDAVEPVGQVTSVRRADGRLQLRTPMDADTLGSPIWTTAGVVGIVQDESSGADLHAVLRKLGD